ncbi:hypothetical protein [Nonomuraea sp. NEAU-A123]|uniref:hypothetical protein n=1 Tax=Nonomuraea sp. NEAU-A123 TaxID=2839649 RepID=UPI001BE4500E|nr:hypothetical protein [Nonomuraea sp. NEAU-A123]MBT2235757.1 hypothetical protein [Nonomuraea sp. NEAU-A123]
MLTLMYLLYLPRARFSNGLEWLFGMATLVGVLAQSGGFLVHMVVGEDGNRSVGTIG